MSTNGSFEAAFERLRNSRAGAVKAADGLPGRGERDESCVCGFGSHGAAAYNEQAFRYFLDIERKRSETSKRPFVLLLVDLKKQPSPTSRLAPAAAEKLLAALSRCVRETDFIGWYRDHAIAGAVLTQDSETVESNLPEAVSRRITDVLRDHLPVDLANMIQVRVYRLPSPWPSVS